MNITQEKIDNLNAVVKVKLSPEDYQAKVDSALKEYTKKVNMPGFRPGKVPVGMVRKMYGKSILADELNKILNDTLYKYIKENNIEILGNPLPSTDEEFKIDLEKQTEFEFRYDIGLAPAFALELSKKDKYPFYSVKIDEDLVNKYVTDLARRYGKLINPDTSEEKDWITADLVELDANKEILAGGIYKSSSIFTERLKGTAIKTALTGLKAEDKLELENSFFSDSDDVAYFAQLLQVPAERLGTVSLRLTVKNINRLAPADMNQELFDKIYGPGEVNSEEEFRARVREELSRMFVNDSDRILRADIKKAMLAKFNLTLPDQFLKRWIMTVNEKPVTPDQVEKEYETYSEQLKWQLVENKILKENQVKVSEEEATDFVSHVIRAEYAKMGKSDVPDDEIKKIAANVLAKEEEGKKIYNQVYERKLLELFKTIFTLEPKELPYDEFTKL